MCHRTTSYVDRHGQRSRDDVIELCPNANGERPCSLTTTGNSRILEERVPGTAVARKNPPVDVYNGSSSTESKGKLKSYDTMEVTLGPSRPSFHLANSKKKGESHRSKGDQTYSSRDNYGMPPHLPSQIPPVVPDAPAPGVIYYRQHPFPIPSPAGPPTMGPPTSYTSYRSGSGGYAGQAQSIIPVSVPSGGRAVVLAQPNNVHLTQYTTPPRDEVRIVVPSSSTSRPSTNASTSEIFSPPASVHSSQTHHSNVVSTGLSRYARVSKDTKPDFFNDSGLGTSVRTPHSSTDTTVGVVDGSEYGVRGGAYDALEYVHKSDRGGRRDSRKEGKRRADTSSNYKGDTHGRDGRGQNSNDVWNDKNIPSPPPPPPPPLLPPFNESSSNYYNSSPRPDEGTDHYSQDDSRESRRRRYHRHPRRSSSSSSGSPETITRPRPRGDGPSDNGGAAVVMSGALPSYTMKRRSEKRGRLPVGDMDETASTMERRIREAEQRFKENEKRSVRHK